MKYTLIVCPKCGTTVGQEPGRNVDLSRQRKCHHCGNGETNEDFVLRMVG